MAPSTVKTVVQVPPPQVVSQVPARASRKVGLHKLTRVTVQLYDCSVPVLGGQL